MSRLGINNALLISDEVKSPLVVAYRQGDAIKEVADKYNVSKTTVVRTLKSHGIKPERRKIKKRKSAIPEKVIIELNEKGLRVTDISSQVGFSYGTIYNVLNKYGLKANDYRGEDSKNKSRLFIDEYISGITIKEISIKYNLAISTVLNTLRRNKVAIRKDLKTRRGKKILELHNLGLTTKEIGVLLGEPKQRIQLYLNDCGIKVHKHYYRNKCTINDDYFKDIDTQNKAYFLGLLLADGCISSNNRNGVHISLKQQDGYLIEKLRDDMESDCAIQIHHFPNKPNWETQVKISVFSKNMKADLIRHGCTPKKSSNHIFPIIPKNLLWHFIRGYFDGDGCICLYKSKCKDKLYDRKSVSIIGSEVFCLKLVDVFSEYGIKGCFRIISDKYSTVTINIKGNVERFGELIYENANVFMKRKRNKFIIQ